VSNRFSSGKNAIAQCDRCNFRFPLKELKQLVIKTKNVNILVCPECWDPDQPQLTIRYVSCRRSTGGAKPTTGCEQLFNVWIRA
jgi:hypothetical protein